MSSISSIDISASGLFAQRVRLDAIANNIANVNTTRTDRGEPYRRQEVVLKTASNGEGASPVGVDVDSVVDSQQPFKMVHDPGHPDADKDGNVLMPNVNIVEEMVDMVAATRAYEANVQAINSAKSMINKAMEIGRA